MIILSVILMRYTEDQLKRMPINILRGLDIADIEEEKVVQRILNTRLVDMPVGIPMNFPASVTDNMTVEKERELQAKIDARNATIKRGLMVGIEGENEESPLEEEDIPVVIPEEETPLMPETAEEVVPETPETAPTDPIEPVEPQQEVFGTVTAVTFCDYCDSLGVRHKKACTRPFKPTE